MSQATEIATQIIERDPETNSDDSLELDEASLADIFCILHPSSPLAHQAAARIEEEYMLSHDLVLANTQHDTENKENEEAPSVEASGAAPAYTKSGDIVLRFSTLPKNPLLGFCFGRSKKDNDFELRASHISNRHFQIYVNEYGTIMLEDVSRNGTTVDNDLLRAALKENDAIYRHTLQHGSIIQIGEYVKFPAQAIRFVVRIPMREGAVEDRYDANLDSYFLRLNAIKMEINKAANPSPPVLFPHAASVSSQFTAVSSVSKGKRKQWRGGEKYNFVRKIGQGAFANVYLMTQKNNGNPFAAKEIEKRRFAKDALLDSKVGNELNIMKRIRHDNIVQFVEYYDHFDYLYIIMEYIPGSDLSHMIREHGILKEDQVRDMTSQLLSALGYLHSRGIAHRDIKPDNIMLSNHAPIRVKLTDFGLSKMMSDEDSLMVTFCGTLLYCAPEVYNEFHDYDRQTGDYRPDRTSKRRVKVPYSNACDLWSLGGVLFFALCRQAPYPVPEEKIQYQDLLHIIMTKALDIRPLQKENLSEECIDFLKRVLQKWPEKRPPIEKLETHPWITGMFATQTTTQTTTQMTNEGGSQMSELEPTEYIRGDSSSGSRSLLGVRDENDDISNNGSLDEIDRDNLGLSLERTFEIPSSIDFDESSFSESFAFMKNGPDRERLFGELGSSALGSSGVIPNRRLNLPLSEHQYGDSIIEPTESFVHPLLHARNRKAMGDEYSNTSDQNSPSLFGTESALGQLQVRSPSLPSEMTESPEALSPEADAPGTFYPSQSFVTAPSTSMRRQREEEEEEEDEAAPAPKRTKLSNKPDDYILYHNYWWDPRDQRTWHDDYPVMTLGELKKLEAEAEAQGKKYKPSRTTETPKYANPADYDTFASAKDDSSFQVPPRILARLKAVKDTALPNIAISVTEQFTSWGRGFANTHVYHNGQETRISKYALKLVLYNPDQDNEDVLKDPNSSFYASTKGLCGLLVNGVSVPSFERSNPRGESRNWVKLRKGDLIQIWEGLVEEPNITLKFDCVFGASAQERSSKERTCLVPEGKERAGLEAITVRCEDEVWERAQREHAKESKAKLNQRASTEPPSRQPNDRATSFTQSMPAANQGKRVTRARGPLERVRKQSGVSANLPPTLNGRGSNSFANSDSQSDRIQGENNRKSFSQASSSNRPIVPIHTNGQGISSTSMNRTKTSSVSRRPTQVSDSQLPATFGSFEADTGATGNATSQQALDTILQPTKNKKSSASSNAKTAASQTLSSRPRPVPRQPASSVNSSFADSEAETERL